MATPFLAEIRMFCGNFAPARWALCNGQILPISQNTALFSLVGTFYGGNGTSNFGLPNLQGRIPIGQGNGNGLSPVVIGEQGGSETVTLLSNQLPIHNHTGLHGFTGRGGANEGTPTANASLAPSQGGNMYDPGASGVTPMATNSVGQIGGNQPHNNMMPGIGINFIIALAGVFPARN